MSEVMPLLPWREYYYIVDLVYPEESAPEKDCQADTLAR